MDCVCDENSRIPFDWFAGCYYYISLTAARASKANGTRGRRKAENVSAPDLI
jgi:hypothetical protein